MPSDRPDAETMTSPAPRGPAPGQSSGESGARFLPGQILSERYRMIGLLGKGGMGEVYRADDLKLGQSVALKFLPADVEADPDRLARFLTEVRLSHRVTHPNVCRVFDIGQTPAGPDGRAGRHFLSMEYVDGEDLASLLRRIGRLPEDKAVEVARQLCAGLAAAHDEGVLHRDLKPANIMIDGRGRAKITDFGLAGATAGVSGREAQAGTPQYMAPEQFDGRELSPQSDLYSLGLVLYELFTGRRAYDSRDLNEQRALRSSTPTSPSAHVAGLNPIIERAILRCLAPDPAQRPRSAASLAAALPGGDPLEMALAAGETPSPQMVARAGGAGELRIAVAASFLAVILVGLAGIWIMQARTTLPNLVPMPKPPEELRVAARAAITAAGYTSVPSGSAYGFFIDNDYLRKVERENQSPDRWNRLGLEWPPALSMWYREYARGLRAFNDYGTISNGNPPTDQPGMFNVRVDPSGRLLHFRAVPPSLPDTPGPWAEPDWAPLFTAAGLTIREWQAADPDRSPLVPSDLRRAWSNGTTRIEAASMRGKPVWFYVIPEWFTPADAVPAGTGIADVVMGVGQVLLAVAVIGGAALMARRNVRLDRGDKRGARRLAMAFLGLGAAAALLELSGTPAGWFETYLNNVARDVYMAALIWMFYLAIEPYVRRHWPTTMVAWSRVLEGRLRDPLVGRHILIGATAGIGFSLLGAVPFAAPLFGIAGPTPRTGYLEGVTSLPLCLAHVFNIVQESFFIPIVSLLVVLLCRIIFRRPWIAYGVLVLGPMGLSALEFGPSIGLGLVTMITVMLFVSLILVVLTRFGLFALLIAIQFSYWSALVLTTDPSSWMFASSVATIGTFAAIAAYGFWISLGDQKLFADNL